jgi:hypothetical protein
MCTTLDQCFFNLHKTSVRHFLSKVLPEEAPRSTIESSFEITNVLAYRFNEDPNNYRELVAAAEFAKKEPELFEQLWNQEEGKAND